jgi:hypothetical protein
MALLETFSIVDNGISGSVPSAFGDLTSLTSLFMANNSLSGTLPSSLAKLTSVDTCGLERIPGADGNVFSCPLPTLPTACVVSCTQPAGGGGWSLHTQLIVWRDAFIAVSLLALFTCIALLVVCKYAQCTYI